MTERPALRALAEALGIENGYHSAFDGRFVATADATREALAAAMGFDASSEDAAAHCLARLAEEDEPADPPPARCFEVDEQLGGRNVFGLWTNLYSMRSRRNAGFGNLGDLEELVRRAGSVGAAFVGLSPLHATTHRPGRFCPYDPVSRIYRDPLYVDLERVPELAFCDEARGQLESSVFCDRLASLRDAERLDVAGAESAVYAMLRPLHAAFRSGTGDAAEARQRAYHRYCTDQGDDLTGFARYLALADHFESETGGRDWRRWPEAYREAHSGAVRAFAKAHAETVEFHAWIQFELDRQLAEVAHTARDAGLPIGLCTDLALGSSAGGSDTWWRTELFVHGASVGAPPDAFSRNGQDWCFPPLDPRSLRRDGGEFFSRLLEANTSHAGALRLDHALGLRRLFWIPEGATPAEGAYVRQPEAELMARLAEISLRQRAVIIAEDLGTVPPGFSEEIRERGLLSTRVLLFERDAKEFRSASEYPVGCLASANTHDLPPLAALTGEEDLALRRRVGQIPDEETFEALRFSRRSDRRALTERLMRDGYLDIEDITPAALPAAVTAFMCATPARLVGIALDDLAGEQEPINLPGVSAERHPSWTRRMRLGIDEIFASRTARRMLDAVGIARRTADFSAPTRLG